MEITALLTEGGDDSISLAGSASGSYIYGNLVRLRSLVGNLKSMNTGDDSAINAGLMAYSIYEVAGKIPFGSKLVHPLLP